MPAEIIHLARQRIFRLSATIVALALAAFAAPAALACEDTGIRIINEQRDDVVHVFAEAGNCLEATVTFNARLTNLRASPTLPAIVELKGNQRVEIATLRPIAPGKWNFRSDYQWQFGTRGGRPDGTVYRLPFAPGRRVLMQSHRGRFSHGTATNNEYALDWTMPVGTPILAARDGVVVAIRQDSSEGGTREEHKKCANYVVVRHRDGTYGEYLHLQLNGVRVRPGETVATGQLLGLSGNTGFASAPHLHFAVFHTIDGGKRRTFPVKFADRAGRPLALVEGNTY